jgi:hypothetical protein
VGKFSSGPGHVGVIAQDKRVNQYLRLHLLIYFGVNKPNLEANQVGFRFVKGRVRDGQREYRTWHQTIDLWVTGII